MDRARSRVVTITDHDVEHMGHVDLLRERIDGRTGQ
jgi:hypothetical protein